MRSFEIAVAMTEEECLKCSKVVQFIRAGDLEEAKSVIEAMTESGMDKLLQFLEAKVEEAVNEDHH